MRCLAGRGGPSGGLSSGLPARLPGWDSSSALIWRSFRSLTAASWQATCEMYPLLVMGPASWSLTLLTQLTEWELLLKMQEALSQVN